MSEPSPAQTPARGAAAAGQAPGAPRGSEKEASRYAPLPEDSATVRMMTAFNRMWCHIVHDVRVHAPCSVPDGRAAILVCNHTSGADPLFIQSACKRLITWMMAAEYFDVPIPGLAWVFRSVGVIPVQRSGRDMAATRMALRALQDGKLLGIFPEGRIETGREMLPFQTGVAMMAIKSGVPVYPAYLDGTQRGKEIAAAVLTRCRATIIFGPPVEFDRSSTSRESLDVATARIRAAVDALRLESDARRAQGG